MKYHQVRFISLRQFLEETFLLCKFRGVSVVPYSKISWLDQFSCIYGVHIFHPGVSSFIGNLQQSLFSKYRSSPHKKWRLDPILAGFKFHSSTIVSYLWIFNEENIFWLKASGYPSNLRVDIYYVTRSDTRLLLNPSKYNSIFRRNF